MASRWVALLWRLLLRYLNVCCKGFTEANGYENVRYNFFRAVPNTTFNQQVTYGNATCGIPTQYSYNFFRPASDPEYPWTGIIFGLTISGVWYWCTDQVAMTTFSSALHHFAQALPLPLPPCFCCVPLLVCRDHLICEIIIFTSHAIWEMIFIIERYQWNDFT